MGIIKKSKKINNDKISYKQTSDDNANKTFIWKLIIIKKKGEKKKKMLYIMH